MAQKPNVNSAARKEMDKSEKQFDDFQEQVSALTLDRMNKAPLQEVEPQTKIAQRDIAKSKDVYLKPIRSIGSKEKFNEEYRDQWNHDKEYIHMVFENREVIGETIDCWTKPYAGVPAEEWMLPTNKPVWVPRYVAKQIAKCKYHRMRTEDRTTNAEGGMTYYGSMVVDQTIARLDAYPAQKETPMFMGASGF